MTNTSKRLFLALDISEQDKARIATWREQSANFAYRPITASNFHITLAFLGGLDSKCQQSLISACQQLVVSQPVLSKQNLVLNELGHFKKPKVLYLNLAETPQWLSYMVETIHGIANNLEIALEQRVYLPHLSLYRKALAQHAQANLAITVSSFSLYHSYSTENGVCYQPIETWPLFAQQQ